jgi:hypothetical protein
MPPFRHWADLPPQLLCRIVRDLKSYVSARGVCTAWRCALVPPTPAAAEQGSTYASDVAPGVI